MDGFRLTNLCIELDFGCANAHAKSVLVALAMSFNEENEEVWVGIDTLARRSACTRNTVFKALAWLENQGLIVKRRTQRSNHYRFNLGVIQSGVLQSMKSNTLQSTKVNTLQDMKSHTLHSIKANTLEKSQSIETNTPQSMKANTLQSMSSNTRTYKEQIKEQIINQSVPMGNSAPVAPVTDLKNCFQSFGSNPVSRPTQWEMDSDNCYDLPLSQQIAMCRKVEVDINDDNHVLTASEIVVLASQLGYRITHNALIDEVAQRKTVTVKIVKEACRRTRENATTNPIGYLVNSIQNASKDPDAFLGIRKAPEITAETLTDGQAYHFAKKLAGYHPWASNNAKYMETTEQMISRVTDSIKNPVFFNNCRWALEKLGLVKEAQHV